jgi:hypothetical protein
VGAEYVTIIEAAIAVGFCERTDDGNKQAAAAKRLKREIDSAETRIHESTEAWHYCRMCRFRWYDQSDANRCKQCESADYVDSTDLDPWIPPMDPGLRDRILRGAGILRGLRAAGGVLHLNLSELRQLCPHLFPVQWERAATEIRLALFATQHRIAKLEDRMWEAEEVAAIRAERWSDRIDLAIMFAMYRHGERGTDDFSPDDGHKRTETDTFSSIDERAEKTFAPTPSKPETESINNNEHANDDAA